MSNNPSFVIRELRTSELSEIENLQRVIWGFSDNEIVRARLLADMQMRGGLVLGAFDNSTVIGFVFSFIGKHQGQYCHSSDLLGVLPDYRSSGIGYALKVEQRKRVNDQGIEYITWTFDPLEGVNASLNFARLGVLSNTYERDMYGSSFGTLNVGLPTDRLIVDWWIQSPHVNQRIDDEQVNQALQDKIETAPCINTIKRDGKVSDIVDYTLDLHSPILTLEIPESFQSVKQVDMMLAMKWRLALREILESYLDRGYLVCDFIRMPSKPYKQNRYIMAQVDNKSTQQVAQWRTLSEF